MIEAPAVEEIGARIATAGVAEYRLVGTASSLLLGVAVTAADVDVLFRTRAGVDACWDQLAGDADGGDPPRWLPESCQYFARADVGGVAVELSTVEIADDGDTHECIGRGPWEHFSTVRCGVAGVPVVGSELRLITEITRGRADHARALVEHLRIRPCDRDLVRRGLRRAGIVDTDIERVVTALT